MATAPGDLPLDGYQVLDLSSGIAGAYCTKLLIDAGAEVTKLEDLSGDPLRTWRGPNRPAVEAGSGALFRFLAGGKRSVVLDVEDPDDLGLALELVDGSDAIVWSDGSALSRHPVLQPQAIHERAGHATVAAITPYGLTGPWRDRPWTEATLQAWTGGAGMRGVPPGPPILAGGELGLWVSGMIAANGLLASRHRTLRTGVGDLIDISMLEAMGYTMASMYPVTYLDIVGEPRYPVRQANLPDIHPTADGFVGLLVATGQQWLDFAAMVERPEWAEDPSLVLYNVRVKRRPEFMAAIDEWTSQRTTADVVELASLFRLPVAAVGNGATVPELAGADRFVWNEHEGFLQPRPSFTIEPGVSVRGPAPAPALGEANEEVRSASRRIRAAVGTTDAADALPFEGLRILDFTAFWAGPVLGSFMAMLGADVIHIESAARPDALRLNTCRSLDDDEWWEWSGPWNGPNTNKRDLTLDLGTEEGRALARRLVAEADVVVENYSPRVMENWGFGYDSLRELKDDIIVVRMPAFGLSGPLRDRVGFAQTLEQVSGLTFVTGEEDDVPVTLNGVCDPVGGTHATIALLLALEHRRRTGQGSLVEASMLGGALNVAAEQVVHHSAYGEVLGRMGNRSGAAAPQGVYLCGDTDTAGGQDRWIAVSVATDEQWRDLVATLGSPAWAADPKLATLDGRRVEHDLLDRELAAWCGDRASEEIVEALWGAGIPVGIVLQPHEQGDVPQLQARGAFETVVHPINGTSRHIVYPARLSNGPERFHRRHPPLLGQDNHDVLHALLDLDDEELARLEQSGVTGTVPPRASAW